MESRRGVSGGRRQAEAAGALAAGALDELLEVEPFDDELLEVEPFDDELLEVEPFDDELLEDAGIDAVFPDERESVR